MPIKKRQLNQIMLLLFCTLKQQKLMQYPNIYFCQVLQCLFPDDGAIVSLRQVFSRTFQYFLWGWCLNTMAAVSCWKMIFHSCQAFIFDFFNNLSIKQFFMFSCKVLINLPYKDTCSRLNRFYFPISFTKTILLALFCV